MNLSTKNQKIFDLDYKSKLEANKSYFLTGVAGCGKTFQAIQLMKKFIETYKDDIGNYPENCIRFIKFNDLIKIARKSNSSNDDGWQARQELKMYKDIDTLIIDDLGTGKHTDYIDEVVYEIIDYRYEEELQTIITSNFSLSDIQKNYSERISSRISGMCEVLELEARDRRLDK